MTNAFVTLTIFTPAYNRARLLPRLFESIQAQVGIDDPVEWLVIDDGSTDETPDVLAGFSARRPDLVRTLTVENGGKHRAINRAAHAARGEWVLIVDSDDRLVANAVAQVRAAIGTAGTDPAVGVIRAHSIFPDLPSPPNFRLPHNPCRHRDWRASQPGFDTAEVVRRSALQQYPFPEFEGERFMAEGWLWHALDSNYLTWFSDQAWIECRYRPDGLSAGSRQLRMASPCGAMAVYTVMLNADLPWRLHARAAINAWRFRFHALALGQTSPAPASTVYALPGWLLYQADRLRSP